MFILISFFFAFFFFFFFLFFSSFYVFLFFFFFFFFFFQAEDGIRDIGVTGVQTCALPIYGPAGTHACPTTLAAVSVPVTVPAGVGQACVPAGPLPRLEHRKTMIPPLDRKSVV